VVPGPEKLVEDIHDIKPAAQIIAEMMEEARQIIAGGCGRDDAGAGSVKSRGRSAGPPSEESS
jgi:hypothetical protein